MAVMNNKEAYALSINSDLRKYVITGVAEIATEVLEEDQTALTPEVAARRLAIARSYKAYTNDFMLQISIQENFNKDITIDISGLIVWAGAGDFSGVVNTYIETVWNFVAGVSLADAT